MEAKHVKRIKGKSLEKKNSTSAKKVDRISDLPDALIHHILSFRDMTYAIDTSYLSRRWRNVWKSLPILILDSFMFLRNYEEEERWLAGFLDSVDRMLLFRDDSDIHRFELDLLKGQYKDCPKCDIITGRVHTWIHALVRRNIQEVSIGIYLEMSLFIHIPECLLNCKSLTSLELVMKGKHRSAVILPKYSMHLPSLKSLVLKSLAVFEVERANKLIASCPVLETLILVGIKTDDHLNLTINSSTLKLLEVNDCGYDRSLDYTTAKIIKLNAPNLLYFICEGYMTQGYSLENLSSLQVADIEMNIEKSIDLNVDPDTDTDTDDDKVKEGKLERYLRLSAEDKTTYGMRMAKFLGALHNVEELRLYPTNLEVISGVPGLLLSLPHQFCKLRHVKLELWHTGGCFCAVTLLLKIAPNIESLYLSITQSHLVDVVEDWDAGLSFPTMLQNLKLVEVRGAEGRVSELVLLECLLRKAVVLEKLVVFTCEADSNDIAIQMKKFNEKLLSFPRVSSDVTILIKDEM